LSSLPIRQKQLGLKDSKHPEFHGNDGFKVDKKIRQAPAYHGDWAGTVKGKTKHTYKVED